MSYYVIANITLFNKLLAARKICVSNKSINININICRYIQEVRVCSLNFSRY